MDTNPTVIDMLKRLQGMLVREIADTADALETEGRLCETTEDEARSDARFAKAMEAGRYAKEVQRAWKKLEGERTRELQGRFAGA